MKPGDSRPVIDSASFARNIPLVGPEKEQETAGEVARFLNGESLAGDRIGAYRLVERIGAGGMGDVYKAVRDDDVYLAEVAIKIMRADMRSASAERRFKSERQILAALDHRNIARLLDGGTTSRGLPYVVMELVAGEPIDQYCDAKSLDTRERVRLFLQVCAAVSFAHQHLIVHRDLKPNNIFVTTDGSAKLLDFGVAKFLEPDPVTGKAADETRTQLRAMTLEYASPEQASGVKVSTASDVYSLGVVLYRLLTGHSPYRARGGDAARMAEILGDTTPERPSALVTPHRRAIDADLDHILLMALRKEPVKRYASVEQLAADLRNYLGGLPVAARRGTLAYRGAKFLRRHKASIAAGMLVAVSLIVGLGFSIRETVIANEERATAQGHFNRVRQLSNRLFDFHDSIAELQGATKAREMLLKTSLEYLDALYRERSTDRALQEELANAYRRVAQIQGSPFGGNTGDTQGALASYQRATELAESLHEAAPENPRVMVLLAEIFTQQAYLLVYVEGTKSSQEAARRAMFYAAAAAKSVPDAGDRAKLLVDAYWADTMALAQSGKRAEASAVADRMIAIAEEYVASRPEEKRAFQMLAGAYGNAGIIPDPDRPRETRFERTTTLMRKAIGAHEKLVALAPTEVGLQWALARSRMNLGSDYFWAKLYREALEQFDLALPVLNARAADGADSQAQLVALMTASFQAWTHFHLGRVTDAQSELQSIVKELEALAATYDNLQARYVLAVTRIRLGALYASRNDGRKARPLLRAGVEAIQEVGKVFFLDGEDREELNLALALLTKNP
jgi:tetratricopeptide (TPR) repeat protein